MCLTETVIDMFRPIWNDINCDRDFEPWLRCRNIFILRKGSKIEKTWLQMIWQLEITVLVCSCTVPADLHVGVCVYCLQLVPNILSSCPFF